MIFLFLHISFVFKVPRYLLVQKYEERLETARKTYRKWQRTLKFNGLCGSTWIKNDQVLIFLLKIFGVLANICIFAHEIFKNNNYGNTNKVHERAFAARIR